MKHQVNYRLGQISMNKQSTINAQLAEKGFSLVEIMVALVIGLITVLVVTQVTVSSIGQRQAATSGADATINSALALYTIERDGKNAGYGISTVRGSLGCKVRSKRGAAALTEFQLLPAVITDGASGAPDTLQFRASNKNGIALPTRIAVDHAKTASNFYVDSDVGIQAGDLMIAVTDVLDTSPTPTRWCTLFAVTAAPAGGGSNLIWHETSNVVNPATSIMPNSGYVIGDYLINLGSFMDRTYYVDAATNELKLTEIDFVGGATTTQSAYPNIVQLQAVYGLDTDADKVVDSWTATAPTTPVEWQQIRALRVALVARGREREAGIVTLDGDATASTCASDTPHPAAICWRPDPTGNGVKIDVNIGNANPDWQHYRYQVVETTIPLRNVVWQQ